MLLPSKKISPDLIGTSFVTALDKVDFPQPDSPASAYISPSFISRDMLSTAVTCVFRLLLTLVYSTVKFFISNKLPMRIFYHYSSRNRIYCQAIL